MTRLLSNPWVLLCCVVFGHGLAAAQTKVSIQPAPEADLSLHVATTQEFSITMDSNGVMPPVQIQNKAAFGFTQVNGPVDKGRLEAQLTIDRLETEETLNGKTKTADTGRFVGQSLTAVFDGPGKLVSLTVPKELQSSSSRLRSLIAVAHGALSNVGPTALSVGESVTVPWDVPLRLPGASTEAPYKIQTVLTLRAIDTRGKVRIARLDQRIESVGDSEQMKVTGGGTVELNLDRGFVSSSSTEWTLTGSYRTKELPETAAASKVQAVMKVTTTATE